MSSNFWHSSHARYHLHPRSRLSTARSTDLRYCTPRQHYCLGIWFANLIQKLGKRLLLRQIPIATATVFFRRFYLKNSICETNPYLVLAACVFVAAKVEETPVHIKSVVTEAKLVFAENHIKIFPAESHKLGEMEFYLLEDLDFHLIVFHPYRALLHICGREPADGGKFPRSRVEEDGEVKRREGERGRKREEIRKAEMGRPPVALGSGLGSGSGGGAGVGVGAHAGAGAVGHAGTGAKGLAAEDDEEESEEKRIRRLMGRGTGEGLMEIEESVLQICLFLLNDTYRTDVHLLYPPYVIALSALYIGFCLTALNNATSTRTRSSSSQLQTLASSIEVNAALGLPPPPKDAAEFIASFEVAMPVLLACVQDIVVLYPIWEAFEPTQRAGAGGVGSGAGGMNAGGAASGGIGGGVGMGGGLGAGMAGNTGMGMTTLAAAAAAASGQNGLGAGAGAGAGGGKKDAEGKEKFGPEEAEALVRRMIEERMVDVGHPDNAGVTGAANGGAATGTGSGNASGNSTAGAGGSGIAQVAGKKRKA